MREVRAEQGHGDEVEEDDERVFKSLDDHGVGAVLGELGEFAVHPDGEVEDVEDDEGEDGESAPDHEARGLAGLNGVVELVLWASIFVLSCELDGSDDVENEADEESDACDPDAGAVEKVVEEVGVVVEGFGTCVDEEVSREVAGQKEDEGRTSDGDDDFFTNGGVPEGREGANREIHSKTRRRISCPLR